MADGPKSAGRRRKVVHQDLPPPRGLPENITFNDLIARNKRSSALLVALMVVIIILFGSAVGVILVAWSGGQAENGIQVEALVAGAVVGGVLGVVASVVASVWSWFGGANAILRMTGSREIGKADDPQLFNVVEELALAGGLPLPRICVIDDPSLNAFATGRDPEHAAVAITSGLRRRLSRDELAGVMAHELSHIKHYDIRLGMLMATLAGIIVFAADAGGRAAYYSFLFGGRRGGGGRSGGGGGANPLVIVIIVIAVIFAIVAPLCAMLVRFAMSRQREYLADAGAVELTRYPDGLIGALKKLENCRQPLRHVGKSTAPLFIVNPLKAAVRRGRHDASNAFSTHPPLSERIQRLRALKSG